MAAPHTLRCKTASQIVFADGDVGPHYKSLYLDTLGDAARTPKSAMQLGLTATLCGSSGQGSSSRTEGGWRPEEHYIHGTLTTQGVAGAQVPRPTLPISGDMVHPLVKDWAQEDRGMSPRRLHPEQVSRTVDSSLTTTDISGAAPDEAWHSRLAARPRGTNPLDPQYRLPSVPAQAAAAAADAGASSSSHSPERDPLYISDIEGTHRRQRCRSPERSNVLVIEDIEGTNAQWRPHRKQHFGVNLRDAGLKVDDIKYDLPRHKLLQQLGTDWAAKGDPAGPRAASPVRPRTKADEQDNSLRTMDIEGIRLMVRRDNDPFVNKFVRRQAKNTVTSCADIEGAQTADRDKVHVFERRKAAAAAADAAKAAGSSALSTLVVERPQLEVMWRTFQKKDREGSGLVTGAEFESALTDAAVRTEPGQLQQLLAGLQDNTGLVNYQVLAKQLKQRFSASAAPPAAAAAAAAAAATASGPATGATAISSSTAVPRQTAAAGSRPSSQGGSRRISSSVRVVNSRPSTAPQGSVLQTAANTAAPLAAAAAAADVADAGNTTQQQQQTGARRPSSSSSSSGGGGGARHATISSSLVQYYNLSSHRPGSAPAAGKHLGAHNPEPFRTLSHWFGGSLRDAQAIADTSSWKPTYDASHGISTAGRQLTEPDQTQLEPTEVPPWMMGTAQPTITSAVQQSGHWQTGARPATAAASGRATVQPNKLIAAATGVAAVVRQRPSTAAGRLGSAGSSRTRGTSAHAGKQGMPARGMGLAEHRREVEAQRRDLATVRQLQ